MIQAVRNITRIWGNSTRDFRKAMYDALTGYKVGEVNVDPPNIAAGQAANVVIALPAGTAKANDAVTVIPPLALELGLVPIAAAIAADDQLTIRIYNPTAGAIDGAARIWTYEIINATSPRPVAT